MAMSRVTLRIATSTAASGAIALALAGCASVGTTGTAAGSMGSTTTAPATSSASASAAPGATGDALVPADGVSACTGAQIRQSQTGAGAGMGHLGDILVFTNISGSTCTLTGYPGASVGFPSGTHSDATRTMQGYLGGAGGYTTPPVVTLAAGATASAMLMWTDVDDPSATCQTADYTELLTTTPNTQSTATYQGTYSCENLQVTPVVPGSTGSSSSQ